MVLVNGHSKVVSISFVSFLSALSNILVCLSQTTIFFFVDDDQNYAPKSLEKKLVAHFLLLTFCILQ